MKWSAVMRLDKAVDLLNVIKKITALTSRLETAQCKVNSIFFYKSLWHLHKMHNIKCSQCTYFPHFSTIQLPSSGRELYDLNIHCHEENFLNLTNHYHQTCIIDNFVKQTLLLPRTVGRTANAVTENIIYTVLSWYNLYSLH